VTERNKWLEVEYDDEGRPVFIWFHGSRFRLSQYQIDRDRNEVWYRDRRTIWDDRYTLSLSMYLCPEPPPPPPAKRTWTQAIGLRRPVAP
jgi:hypothetical protein